MLSVIKGIIERKQTLGEFADAIYEDVDMTEDAIDYEFLEKESEDKDDKKEKDDKKNGKDDKKEKNDDDDGSDDDNDDDDNDDDNDNDDDFMDSLIEDESNKDNLSDDNSDDEPEIDDENDLLDSSIGNDNNDKPVVDDSEISETDSDDLLTVEIDLKSNTTTDTIPIPPDAASQVIEEESIIENDPSDIESDLLDSNIADNESAIEESSTMMDIDTDGSEEFEDDLMNTSLTLDESDNEITEAITIDDDSSDEPPTEPPVENPDEKTQQSEVTDAVLDKIADANSGDDYAEDQPAGSSEEVTKVLDKIDKINKDIVNLKESLKKAVNKEN